MFLTIMREVAPLITEGMEYRVTQMGEYVYGKEIENVVCSAILGEEEWLKSRIRTFRSFL